MPPTHRGARPARLPALSLAEARRVALAAQGFAAPRPRGRVTARHLERVLEQLEVLQLDYVNVLVPAHYLVPFSRLGPYDRARLEKLIYREGKFTEQWAHMACVVPMRSWGLFAHRRAEDDRRVRSYESYLRRHAPHAEAVLEAVRARGPLAAGEVAEPDGGRRRRGAWWDWGVTKTVFEGHFVAGRFAIADRRPDFARLYDLAERVIPEPHRARSVDTKAAHRELVRRAARALGVATARDLADYFRMRLGDAAPHVAELMEAGELRPVSVEGWREPAYLHAGAARPRRLDARALLSPFDPVVWYRPRAERLFDFHYRIEIYTPQARRRFGYYVLPFLLGDRIVARVDLKADRAARTLRVLAAHRERHAPEPAVAAALAEELGAVSQWLGLERVAVGRRGDLARALAGELPGRARR